eukprot:TRINITY_DN10176_c0_g2_i1.p1 TRINITY_DN10176_c0_g2~~TRINITY_DN10176_c0_g2_i1.p1  ORF type:complete len:375 (-),score=65.53 TRINITY_DN10176_c0_g2_i1:115-1152(-)
MDLEDTTDFLNLEVLGMTLAKPGETGRVQMPGVPDANDLKLQDFLEETDVHQEDEPDLTLMGTAVPPLKRPTSGASGSTRAGEGSEDALSFRSEVDDYLNSDSPTGGNFLRVASAPNFGRPDSELGSRPNTAMSQAGKDAWASLVLRPRGAVVVEEAWRPSASVGSKNSPVAVPSSAWCKLSSQARMDAIQENSSRIGSSYLARAVQLASSVGGSSRPTTSLSGEKLASSLGLLASSRTSGASGSVRTAKHLPSKMHSQRWWPKSMIELRDETLRALDPQNIPEFWATSTPSTPSRPPSRVGSSASLRSAGKRKVNWAAGLPTVAFPVAPHGGFPQDVNSRVGAP